MEIKQKVVNYYVANDGIEFDDENACLAYEKEIERIKNSIRYYELSYGYGDNGFMVNTIEIAVFSENQHLCDNIILEWATKERNMDFLVMANLNGREETIQKGFNVISKSNDYGFVNHKI